MLRIKRGPQISAHLNPRIPPTTSSLYFTTSPHADSTGLSPLCSLSLARGRSFLLSPSPSRSSCSRPPPTTPSPARSTMLTAAATLPFSPSWAPRVHFGLARFAGLFKRQYASPDGEGPIVPVHAQLTGAQNGGGGGKNENEDVVAQQAVVLQDPSFASGSSNLDVTAIPTKDRQPACCYTYPDGHGTAPTAWRLQAALGIPAPHHADSASAASCFSSG